MPGALQWANPKSKYIACCKWFLLIQKRFRPRQDLNLHPHMRESNTRLLRRLAPYPLGHMVLYQWATRPSKKCNQSQIMEASLLQHSLQTDFEPFLTMWGHHSVGCVACCNRGDGIAGKQILDYMRSCGPMDKASDYESGDCRFESCQGQIFNFLIFPKLFRSMAAMWQKDNRYQENFVSWPRVFKNVAPPGGLEPPTFRLTAERASQLRHGGMWCYWVQTLSFQQRK